MSEAAEEGAPRLPDGEPLEAEEGSHSEEHYDDLSVRGTKLSPELLEEYLPPGDGGVVIHAALVLADQQTIKARRPQPLPVHASVFLAGLVSLRDGRFAFSGPGLNGWKALTCLELRSLTARRKSPGWRFPGMGQTNPVVRVWNARDLCSESQDFPAPAKALQDHIDAHGKDEFEYRATLRCAPWTLEGWSRSSPGCVWWYEKQSRPADKIGPADQPGRVLCGEGMLDFARKDGKDPECVKAYLLHHRYALPGGRKETTRDKLTWHSLVLLEWRHHDEDRSSFTVAELATLNGCSGRGGRANWHEDRNEPVPMLKRAMPKRMDAPWDVTRGEIRVHDITAKSFDEFKAFVEKYSGPLGRFLDPEFTHEHEVRLSFRSKTNIMKYLINYMGRDFRYNEAVRNCQTFATDLFAFLAGKKDISPYSNIVSSSYVPRPHLFLYDYRMFVNPNGVIEYTEKYAARSKDAAKKNEKKE